MSNLPPDARQEIPLRMSGPERDLFRSYLKSKPVYLEFGCGGSTQAAVLEGCNPIVSVDSDQAWINKLGQVPMIASRIRDRTLFLEYVDIGPVGEWGAPKDHPKILNWPNYGLAPYLRHDFKFQFILIDGRFRQACAYITYAFMSDDALMAVHDYALRPSYFDLERFFEVHQVADTLVVFKKKKNIMMQSLALSLVNSLNSY